MSEGTVKLPPAASQSERRLAKAVERASQAFTEKNLRFTKLRQDVFQEIAATYASIGAYDVLARLAEKGTRLAPISVYRALDFLVENRFAHRIESKNAYVACDRGEDCSPEATLFLICDNCGAAGEAPSEALGRLVSDETKRSAFMPRLRVLEIRGLCARCRD